jgi:hypothetical protein
MTMLDKLLGTGTEMYSALRESENSTQEKLSLSADDGFDESQSIRRGYRIDKPRRSIVPWVVHLLIIASYSIGFFGFTHTSKVQVNHLVFCKTFSGSGLILITKAPLHESIEMERKMVRASFQNKNPFKGEPSDELDHAWHQLFINSNVRVTEDDLAKVNKTSVPITDARGGYYAIPGR